MALDFFAGCIGGCASIIVGHPFDTVKTNLQTQDANNPKFRGSLSCIRSLMNNDGARGLFRGMTSPLLGVAAINAIVFGIYGNVQRNLSNPDGLMSHFIAGGTAGFFQSFICSPMELAKSRLQVSNDSKGPLECLTKMYKQEGLRSIFRGLNMTIAREVPAFGIYFWTYEYLTRNQDGKPISTAHMLTAGGVAGIMSWLLIYPIDVIKSRIQTDGVVGPRKYNNSLDCIIKSVKLEGYQVLFRGLAPTMIRAFPVNATTFTVVTWTIRLLSHEDKSVEYRMKESETLLKRCLASTLNEVAVI